MTTLFAMWACAVLASCGCDPSAVALEFEPDDRAIQVANLRWSESVLQADVTAQGTEVHQLDFTLYDGQRAIAAGSLRGPFAPGAPTTVRFEGTVHYTAGGSIERAQLSKADRVVLAPIRLEPRPELVTESDFTRRSDNDCRLGDLLKCADLAEKFESGEGVTRRDVALHEAYGALLSQRAERECGRGAADACFVLGVEKLRGRAIPRDEPGGRLLVQKACAEGAWLACEYDVEATR